MAESTRDSGGAHVTARIAVKTLMSAKTSLRSLRRGYVLAILLIAAWCPFLFPGHRLLMLGVMAVATATFRMATTLGPEKASPPPRG